MNGLLQEFLQKSGLALATLVVTTVASFLAGRWWGRYRARKQWETKQFLGRIIVSLNSFADDALRIRTIFEKSVEEVFLNAVPVEMVLEAARRTTKDDPILPVAKEDCWFLLNCVLNAVAEEFSAGYVREDAGQPVKKATYALCLTCEAAGEVRQQKIRVMMLRKELLQDFPYKDRLPKLDKAWHETRVRTLRQLAQAYQTRPEQFIHLEICV